MSTLEKSTIFVDADSCPVKEEIVEIADRFQIPVLFVASYNHFKQDKIGINWKFVDANKEEVDLFILNHAKKGDVVITQDIGLASTLLLKDVYILHPRGSTYLEKNIEEALYLRYIHAKERRRGNYGKGPKPYTLEDKKEFEKNLSIILSKIKGIP